MIFDTMKDKKTDIQIKVNVDEQTFKQIYKLAKDKEMSMSAVIRNTIINNLEKLNKAV